MFATILFWLFVCFFFGLLVVVFALFVYHVCTAKHLGMGAGSDEEMTEFFAFAWLFSMLNRF